MLTKTVPSTKQVPVHVIEFTWHEPLDPDSQLVTLPCSACRKPIGSKRWGIAWAQNRKYKYTMRLCEDCGTKAGATLAKENEDGKT